MFNIQLVIRETQLKATMRYHDTTILRIAKIKQLTIPSAALDANSHTFLVGVQNSTTTLEQSGSVLHHTSTI